MRTRGKGAENLRGVPVDGGDSKGGTDKKGAQPKAADILKNKRLSKKGCIYKKKRYRNFSQILFLT